MKPFLHRWAVTALALLVAIGLPGIEAKSAGAFLLASLFLAVLNAVVRPVLMLLSLPLIVFSLGTFLLFLNAILLRIVGELLAPGFVVANFRAALLGSIVVSVISWLFKPRRNLFPVVVRTATSEREPRFQDGMKPVQGRVIEREDGARG